MERNVYATEVRRLQQLVKKLKLANGKIGHENRVVGRLKAKNHHLEVMNLRLSSCLSASLSQVIKWNAPFTSADHYKRLFQYAVSPNYCIIPLLHLILLNRYGAGACADSTGN